MANLGILNGFNANDHEDTFSPLPAGDYEAEIIDSEMVENKAGTGQFLKVTLKILSGDSQGRQVFDRFNLIHDNPKAVEIAHTQFAGLCKAAGVLSPSDSSELHNIPLVVTLAIDGDWNRVKRYKGVVNVTKETKLPEVENDAPKAKSSRKSKAKVAPAEEEFNDDLPF